MAALEDLSFYCVDNLPAQLIDQFLHLCHQATPPIETVALAVAERIGYPVLVRPSYVLGGRAMEIVYDEESLEHYLRTAVKASPRHPVLIDRFLEHSTEVDVDALCDGEDVYIGAVMQHVEEAGIHSGDSACVIPAVSLGNDVVKRIEEQTASLARELGVTEDTLINWEIRGVSPAERNLKPVVSRFPEIEKFVSPKTPL